MKNFLKTIFSAMKIWIKGNIKEVKTGLETKMELENPVGIGSFSMNRKADTEIGNYSHAEGYETTASAYYSHAEGCETTASEEASHAEGGWTTASGNGSHAEGGWTTASGNGSHAEGCGTTASGNYSHAEGCGTTASGDDSHAEGSYTTASGDDSHAEGSYTTASGNCSHAEGYNTTASGNCSHAEGYNTTASGDDSHAEGRGTIAIKENSHVEGKYNIPDFNHKLNEYSFNNDRTNDILLRRQAPLFVSKEYEIDGSNFILKDPIKIDAEELYNNKSNYIGYYGSIKVSSYDNTSRTWKLFEQTETNILCQIVSISLISYNFYNYKFSGTINMWTVTSINKYVHIVGNGTSDTERSNAHTLDWEGNAWFAGNIYIGGTSQDDTSAIKVAIVPFPTEADEGKILHVVNGVPTWASIPNAEEATS